MNRLKEIAEEMQAFQEERKSGESPQLDQAYEEEFEAGKEWLAYCMTMVTYALPAEGQLLLALLCLNEMKAAASGIFAYGFLRGWKARGKARANDSR